VILSTLKALRIRMDLKADKFDDPEPRANSIMLTDTTPASKRFITSVKKLRPYARILRVRSMTKMMVKD
jgi:hypothetical protein